MHGSLTHKTLTLVVLFLLFVLAFSFQGVRGVWEPDEGYYVGSAVSMEMQKDYLVPTLGEEIFLDKPPILYWGILGGLKLFGHNEFATRFFTGLCFALTVFLVYATEISMSRQAMKALWAAVIYMTMIIPFFAANFVTPDTPLTLFTTASMLAFWQTVRPESRYRGFWQMALCLLAGLAFLSKGPAALIPCGAMFVYLLLQKQLKRFLLSPWLIPGIAVFLLAGLSWYVYIAWKLPDAGAYFFDNMIWGRLVSGKYQRNPGALGALIYLPVILLGTMPWSTLWYHKERGIGRYIHVKTWKALSDHPDKTLLACWIIVPLTVLCLASSKLGLYALPIFPAIALATARLIPDRPTGTADIQPPKIAFVVVWSGLLLIFRIALAAIPSAHNCQSLWHEMKPYIPTGQYEIVTVDERTSGLWFYGAHEVENVTRRNTPYPTYAAIENLESEVSDMQQDNYPHLFLVQGKKHLVSIKQTLLQAGWSVQEVTLKHNRYLLTCNPAE